ncbi:MAG: peptidylprolyl isomerase [Holosporaceae bacterium]|nr:peptidylprolyl isomerase [Holosporaceae bacterium]
MKFRTVCAATVAVSAFFDVDGGALKKQFTGQNQQSENINIGGDEQKAPTDSAGETVGAGETSEATPESFEPGTSPTSLPTEEPDSTASISGEPVERKKIVGDPVVLRINGKKEFRRSQVLEDIKKIPPQMAQGISPDKLFEVLRDQRLNVYLMTEQAKKAGLDRSKEFVDQLEQMKDDLLGRLFLMKELGFKVENEAAVKARYTKYLVEFKKGKEFQIFHILVGTEDEAKSVLAALDRKEEFEKLAREKSTAPSKDKGGEEGYIPVDMMPPEIKDKLIILKSGEYTKEFVKTEHGFHMFKVGEIRETTPLKYEEAVPTMKQLIMREEMVKLMDRLEKQSKVERFNEDGTPAQKPRSPAGM